MHRRVDYVEGIESSPNRMIRLIKRVPRVETDACIPEIAGQITQLVLSQQTLPVTYTTIARVLAKVPKAFFKNNPLHVGGPFIRDAERR
jgi:hypothetical protein